MPVALRSDFDAVGVRCGLRRRRKDGAQARRLLALAAIYDGAARTEAAKIAGVTLQIIRDWVVKFNAAGPEGLIDRKAPGQTPRLSEDATEGARGGDRERADPGGPWRRALAHCRSLLIGCSRNFVSRCPSRR